MIYELAAVGGYPDGFARACAGVQIACSFRIATLSQRHLIRYISQCVVVIRHSLLLATTNDIAPTRLRRKINGNNSNRHLEEATRWRQTALDSVSSRGKSIVCLVACRLRGFFSLHKSKFNWIEFCLFWFGFFFFKAIGLFGFAGLRPTHLSVSNRLFFSPDCCVSS